MRDREQSCSKDLWTDQRRINKRHYAIFRIVVWKSKRNRRFFPKSFSLENVIYSLTFMNKISESFPNKSLSTNRIATWPKLQQTFNHSALMLLVSISYKPLVRACCCYTAVVALYMSSGGFGRCVWLIRPSGQRLTDHSYYQLLALNFCF